MPRGSRSPSRRPTRSSRCCGPSTPSVGSWADRCRRLGWRSRTSWDRPRHPTSTRSTPTPRGPVKRRGRLFERNLEILTRLWTEDRVSLQVDEFNLREAVMRPRPAQHPRPPILIGGYVDAVLKRVATRGDGWLTYFYTPESYRRSWEKIVGFAREAGRDPKTLTGTNQLAIYVGRSREETETPMRRWLETAWDVAAWSESTIEHAIRGSAEARV